MGDTFSSVLNLDDVVNDLNGVLNNTVTHIQGVGLQLLNRLDEIIVSNREGFVNDTKQALLEVVSAVEGQTKENVLEVINQFMYNLSNTAGSVIEHAKNATTNVLGESLEKLRYEADTFVKNIVTNRFFILVVIFILIILFLSASYMYRRLFPDQSWCSQVFKILSNMILIITSLLTILWFGLALVWFFESALDDKNPFYIIVTIILLLAIVYGSCHLGWFLILKIHGGGKQLLHKETSTC